MKESSEDEKRNKIMNYANRVFYEKGFHKVSVDEICRGLTISRRTFYQHFKNKEDLVENLLVWRYGEFSQLVLKNLSSNTSIDEVFMNHFHLLRTELFPYISEQMLADTQVMLPEVWERIEYGLVTFSSYMVEMVKTGQQEGTISKKVDPVVMGKVMQGILLHLFTPQVLMSIGLTADQFMESWQHIFLYGILEEKGRKKAKKQKNM